MSELKTLFIDGGYFEYTTYGSPSGQSYISLVNGVLPEKVCIPAFIDNIPVYNIDFSAFGKNEKVKEIVFEEGIKEIKAYAFY